MEILLGICGIIVTLSCVAVAVQVWIRPRHLEDDALADWIKGIERNVAMLRGRVNRLAPPRLGTGDTLEGDSPSPSPIVAPAASQGHTRAQVLNAWKKGRGL